MNCTLYLTSGDVSFGQTEYPVDIGSAVNITCAVTNYPAWQNVRLISLDTNATIYSIRNSTSGVQTQPTSVHEVSIAYTDGGLAMTMHISSITCLDIGTLQCIISAGDQEKSSTTSVTLNEGT